MLNLPGLLLLLLSSASQARSQRLPSTFPHNYTGIPKGDFSPAWQKYFEVTDPLPNVTEPIARNFAGNIGVNRVGHPNNTLWFWAFEKEEGSLTARPGERDDEPWLIWLNGGPGSSSLVGLMTENGPLQVTGNYSIVENEFSWNKLADAFWVDQPVGTGFSTSDAAGYVDGEDQLGQDFVGFLTNLVKVFPSLATRPFYLTGESYAGTFIMLIPKPYITKAIFSTPNPPVNLRKISIGDGTIGGFALYEELSTVITLETYPEIIGFDPDVFQYFKEQEHLCGYDVNLTYPQHGIIPTITDPFTTTSVFLNSQVQLKVPRKRSLSKRALSVALSSLASRDIESGTAELEERGTILKRNLIGRPNGTLDPTYGCFLWEEMTDYAQNFTFPWTVGEFDAYDIPDALRPEVPSDPSVFLNDNRTRAALHAPIKEWVEIFSNPFGNSTSEGPGTNPFGDPSVEPMAFMTELATNASDRGVHIIIYEGNDDSLVAHRGLQVVIQNITFGGIQGFTRKPATPFTDDEGRFAGIVHQERNLTYALFQNAGHFVPMSVPEAAFVFLREFILGSNTTGLVVESHVVGGEDPVLAEDVMPGTTAIFYGHGTTASSLIVPSATLASWSSFLATATATSL